MAVDQPSSSTNVSDGDLAQAFKDLAKGEKTASVMECQLTRLEKKIDDLLASVDDADPQSANTAAKLLNNGSASASTSASGYGPAPAPTVDAKDRSQ